MQIEKFKGLIAAPFTPLDAFGNIVPGRVPVLADNLKMNGVLGAFIIGSTGEGVSLTLAEKKAIIQAWRKEQAADFKVIVLVASNSLREACDLAEFVQSEGIFGVAVLPPFYFKLKSTAVLIDFFREIAESAPQLPIYYYHIPALTGVNFPMIEFLQLARDIPNLAGIKYTGPDLMDFRKCLTFDGGKYDVLWGIDEVLLSALAMGACGGVGSTYNYAAPLYHELIDAFVAGDLPRARQLQSKSIEIVDILVRYGGIPAGKYFMKSIGLDCGAFRKPLNSTVDMEQFTSDLERINFGKYASNRVAKVGNAE